MEHVDELIPGQALHALSSDDEERVALHVAECERCRMQLREVEAVAASLAYAVPDVAPPANLRMRVLAAVEPVVEAPSVQAPVVQAPVVQAMPVPRPAAARRRPAWWPRVAAVAVPALAAAVIGLVVWNVSLRNDLSARPQAPFGGSAGHLQGVGNVIVNTQGTATLFANIRRAPAGKTYEAWVIRGNVALPAGLFQGGGTVRLKLTQAARPGDVIAVTVEPAGGTKQPTTPVIAHQTV